MSSYEGNNSFEETAVPAGQYRVGVINKENDIEANYFIHEASQFTKLPKKTIRYYEEIGLIPPLQRTQGGYRIFTKGDIRRLRLIKKAKYLGISLEEIKEIVKLAFEDSCRTFETRFLQLLENKISEVNETIKDLYEFRRDLIHTREYILSSHEQFSKDCRAG